MSYFSQQIWHVCQNTINEYDKDVKIGTVNMTKRREFAQWTWHISWYPLIPEARNPGFALNFPWDIEPSRPQACSSCISLIMFITKICVCTNMTSITRHYIPPTYPKKIWGWTYQKSLLCNEQYCDWRHVKHWFRFQRMSQIRPNTRFQASKVSKDPISKWRLKFKCCTWSVTKNMK